MLDVILASWPIVATILAVIVWLIRLEARGIANGSEVRRLWSRRKEDRELDRGNRDRMDRRLDEIGRDIKTLLKGMGRLAERVCFGLCIY